MVRGRVLLGGLLAWALACPPGRARAHESELPRKNVLLLADAPRARLKEMLEIQLRPGARVLIAPALRARSTGDRVYEAQRMLARSGGSVLAMWVEGERVAGELRELIVYVVAGREGRALVEVVRVRGGAEAEVDRAVAVKIREVLDALGAGSDLARAAAASAPRHAASEAESGTARLVPAMGLELAGWTGLAGAQLAVHASLGASVATGPWLAGAAAIVGVPTPYARDASAGSLRVREVILGGVVRAARRADVADVGAFAYLGVRRLRAEGRTPLGTEGAVERLIPFAALGPELGIAVSTALRFHSGLGVEFELLRQRLAVNDAVLLDLGLIRGMIALGVEVLWF